MFRTYFENRELKGTIAQLDLEMGDKADEVRKLHRESVKRDNQLSEQYKKVQKLQTELDKTKKLVREQTGADLLVNALMELGVVPRKASVPDAYAEQDRLRQQMAAMQNSYEYSRGNQQSGLAGLGGLI